MDQLQRARRLAEVAAEIVKTREGLEEAQRRLDLLEGELALIMREYAQPQTVRYVDSPVGVIETTEELVAGPSLEPWKDPMLSLPKRVRAFFDAHPNTEVSAAKLIEAGIDVPPDNLNSALHRHLKNGLLLRPEIGVYVRAPHRQPAKEATGS
jgi:hypothetical protein